MKSGASAGGLTSTVVIGSTANASVSMKTCTTLCFAMLKTRAPSAEADSRNVKSFEVSFRNVRSSGISEVAMVQNSTHAIKENNILRRVERLLNITSLGHLNRDFDTQSPFHASQFSFI